MRALHRELEHFEGDPARAKLIFELFSKPARENLTERAQRYVAASGKPIGPERMIAPASFLRRFEPLSFSTETRGDRARVTIQGPLPSDRATIPCVFEEGAWKLDLRLPALPPAVIRPRDQEVVGPRPK